MTKTSPKKQKRSRRTLVICLLVLLVLGGLLVVLQKTRAINLLAQPSRQAKTPVAEVGAKNINYDPPTQEEKKLADQIKQQAQKSSTSASSVIGVSLSAAGQDTNGGPIIVKAMVGSADGNCTINLSNSSFSKDYTTPINNLGTYYGCGLDIPIDSLSTGNYELKLTANNATATGSATQSVEVRK